MVDIVIPVLNEERILKEKREYYQKLKRHARITFVDGGSTDKTAQIAGKYGQVLSSSPGRGLQKNYGAQQSCSDCLVFLHVDTEISHRTVQQIPSVLNNGISAGCLTLNIQDQRPVFRFFEWAVNTRARCSGVIDGDLGMFIHRKIFEALGGFDTLPYMEDISFSKKLSNKHKITILPDQIFVSSRKWNERGFLKTFFDYSSAYIKLWTGNI